MTGATGQGYTWKGAWSAAAYVAYDSVSYNGSSYVALAANSNVAPGSDATKWDLLAQAALGNFVDLGSNQTISGAKTFSSTITGNISGSAGTISGTITKSQVSDFPALATVAMSGSYGDLLNRPALVASIAAFARRFLVSYDAATGTFTAAQPALGDLSDASSVMTTSTALQPSQMPFLFGDVISPPGTTVTALRAGLNVRTCEVHVWGSGPSGALQLTDGELASCRNKFGVTWAITSVDVLGGRGHNHGGGAASDGRKQHHPLRRPDLWQRSLDGGRAERNADAIAQRHGGYQRQRRGHIDHQHSRGSFGHDLMKRRRRQAGGGNANSKCLFRV